MNSQLQAILDASTNVVAFTGAGISTESGIPDFRSSGGLYMSEFGGKSPEQILSRKFFREDKKTFFSFLKTRMNVLLNREPNRTHLFLSNLEKTGKLKAIVTQNIDDLHNKAGNTNVLELHGNYSRFRCDSACDTTFTCDDFMKQMETAEIPLCTSCGGVIRPGTVLFDEWLDDKTFEKSIEAISQADLLIVIGTGLQVQPAAGLVRELPKTGKMVIVTESTTPYDKLAALCIREKCGDVFDGIQI